MRKEGLNSCPPSERILLLPHEARSWPHLPSGPHSSSPWPARAAAGSVARANLRCPAHGISSLRRALADAGPVRRPAAPLSPSGDGSDARPRARFLVSGSLSSSASPLEDVSKTKSAEPEPEPAGTGPPTSLSRPAQTSIVSSSPPWLRPRRPQNVRHSSILHTPLSASRIARMPATTMDRLGRLVDCVARGTLPRHPLPVPRSTYRRLNAGTHPAGPFSLSSDPDPVSILHPLAALPDK